MKDMILKTVVRGVVAVALWGGAAQAAYTVEANGSQVTVNVDAGDEQTISAPFAAGVTSFLKTGGGTLTIDCANAGLTGDAEIREGCVVLQNFKALGGDADIQWEPSDRQPALYRAKGAIIVQNKARLEIDAGSTDQGTAAIVKRVRLNGSGADGVEVLRVKSREWANQDFFFAYVELGADARIACLDNARYGFRHLDLNGYQLTVSNDYQVFFSNGNYLSGGTVRCICPSVFLKGDQTFAADTQGRLVLDGKNIVLDLQFATSRDFSWGLGVVAGASVIMKYANEWTVAGPLQVDGLLTLRGSSAQSSMRFADACVCDTATGGIVVQSGVAEFEQPVQIPILKDGGATEALVRVRNGATVTNAFAIASGNGMIGAFHQMGGDVRLVTTANPAKPVGSAADAYGYMGVFGGLLHYGGSLSLAVDPTSVGMLDVVGGSLEGYATSLMLSRGGWGELYVSGGKVSLYSNNSATMPHILGANGVAGCGGQAVLTLTGAGPSLMAPWGDWLKLCERTEGFTAVVNLNAGVIDVSSIRRGVSMADADVRSRAFLNFNGGVYRQRYNSTAIFGDGDTAIDRVTVYAGGAVFDTPYTATQSADTPLRAPTGRGVAAIALPNGIENERYIGAPEVRIDGGGGEGATAHALYDPETLCVTNIEVTCPGWDYTSEPRVVICSADRTVTNVCSVTLTEDVQIGGGIVKRGVNTLTLNAINTYVGDTVLEGGTLKVGEGALPVDSTVVFAGGELSDQSGTHEKYAIDCLAAIAQSNGFETWQAMPEGAMFELRNVEGLPEDLHRTTLLTFRGKVAGTPAVTGYDATRFDVRVNGGRIRIARKRGFALVVR